MSITTVHHASMYATQHQSHTGATVLSATVTNVPGGPATFSGLAPSTKAELDQYSVAGDFGGSAAAWAGATWSWVALASGRYYTWNGTAWVTVTVASGAAVAVTLSGDEYYFTSARTPTSLVGLQAVTSLNPDTAWAVNKYITLGGVGSGGDHYYWDGNSWEAGEAPA